MLSGVPSIKIDKDKSNSSKTHGVYVCRNFYLDRARQASIGVWKIHLMIKDNVSVLLQKLELI